MFNLLVHSTVGFDLCFIETTISKIIDEFLLTYLDMEKDSLHVCVSKGEAVKGSGENS